MMEIIEKKLTEIKPYFRNPRKIDGAIDGVAASINEFGFKQPIVVDTEGVIIVGHVRYAAAKKLKLKKVPVVVADNLTEDEVKAYRLADNKSRELSEWDLDKLEYEYARVTESGFNLDDFGFKFNFDEIIEKENKPKEQNLKDCEEFDLDSFSDEQFDYCCPKCGMRFNKKG